MYKSNNYGIVMDVCLQCFQSYPEDKALISRRCKNVAAHKNGGKVSVFWNPHRKTLEEIRPKPNVQLKQGAKFMLCDGWRCLGQKCTYPHSVQERDAWNSQLLEEGNSTPE